MAPRRALIGLLVSLPAASSAMADVKVQVHGGRLDVTARAAPLAQVLDDLARQTGMKVVYDGPLPRQTVTLNLVDRSPAEAVLSLLEGQGVNYALVSDPTGTQVQTLMVTGPAPPSSARTTAGGTTAASTARPAPAMRRPTSDNDEVFEEPENAPEPQPPPDTAQGTAPADQAPPTATAPGPGTPAQHGGPVPQQPPGPTTGTPVPAVPQQPPVQQYPVSPFAPQPPAIAPPPGAAAPQQQ